MAGSNRGARYLRSLVGQFSKLAYERSLIQFDLIQGFVGATILAIGDVVRDHLRTAVGAVDGVRAGNGPAWFLVSGRRHIRQAI